MKKLLLTLLAVVGLSTVATAEIYNYKVSSGTSPISKPTSIGDINVKLSEVDWTLHYTFTGAVSNLSVTNVEWAKSGDTWRGLQFGKSKYAILPINFTAAENNTVFGGKKISSIMIDASAGEADKVQLSVSVNGIDYECGGATVATLSDSHDEYEFTGEEIAGDIVISYKNADENNTTTKGVYLREIEIVYSDPDEEEELNPCETPTFSETSTYESGAIILRSTQKSTITYTIGDEIYEGISPVKMTFDTAGTYEITAQASRAGYADSEEVTKAITVKPGVAYTERFNFEEEDYGIEPKTRAAQSIGKGFVFFDTNKECALYDNGLRFYKDGTFTVTAPKNTEIVDVLMYHSCADDAEDLAHEEEHDQNLEISGNTATFSAFWTSSYHDLSILEIVYAAPKAVHDEITNAFKAAPTEHFTVKVDGVKQTGSIIAIDQTKSEGVKLELSHNIYPHATIYTKFTPKAAETQGMYYDALEGYTAHTQALPLTQEGTLNYYAELNGHQTAVQTLTVSDPTSTSIADIQAAGAAEYFDMQGRRVNAPANGIFIRKQGNKAVKVSL